MKICHLSDWHGNTRRLPTADLYVVTGDMLPNFPLIKIQVDKWRRDGIVTYDPYGHLIGKPQRQPVGVYVGRQVVHEREETFQKQWCMGQPFRQETGLSEDAPVLVVRGNHDFINLSDWIGGDVWEVNLDPTRTTKLFGLKFGGCRGINYIAGEWSDELRKEQFDVVARQLPEDLDVLLTHAPALGIRDFGSSHYGSSALFSYFNRRTYGGGKQLMAHLFGHVHEALGQEKRDETIYSNAATGVQIVEI